MRKGIICCIIMMTMLLTSCGNTTVHKIVDEHKDATSQIDGANDDNDEISSTGSEDWDELLESYEEYVDKYISYLKKASKGDMDALSEYPALMEKAQELSEKIQKTQSDMPATQWARYNKISMKMLKAAQEMQ